MSLTRASGGQRTIELQEGKTKTNVWYEWLHVRRGPGMEPDRVCISVHDILHHDRVQPPDPLSNHAPSNLYFDVQYMQACAEEKCPRTMYEGISFEGTGLRFAFRCRTPAWTYRMLQSECALYANY